MFVSTHSNINWYRVRKYFTKFIKKVRQHAEARQQQQQLQIKFLANTEDPPVNENRFLPGKPSLKENTCQQLYR